MATTTTLVTGGSNKKSTKESIGVFEKGVLMFAEYFKKLMESPALVYIY
jgi:hypothetical protein